VEPKGNNAGTLDPDDIEHIGDLLAGARSALFITGAGISADSGLPTYRGIGGLYDREETEEGIPIELALSGRMLAVRPEIAWKYIYQIESACRGARYNRAHEIIALFEQRLSRTWVLTQNVDGFHRDAGSRNVIEIHGTVRTLLCTGCTWRASVTDYSRIVIPPACEDCGALVRPDVVLFGEMLPRAAHLELDAQLQMGFDIVFSIGTTSAFPYIAQPVVRACRAGIPTVEINPGDTEVSGLVEYRLRARARDAFEAIWSAYLARAGRQTDEPGQ
jgi:NAD-dependent deacetylase